MPPVARIHTLYPTMEASPTPIPPDRGSSVDESEIARFSALAGEWWDTEGKFRPLHAINPIRIAYIRDHLAAHVASKSAALKPLDGLRILDVGCGGGLLCEPLTRLGAEVTAIDAGEANIEAARTHAAEMGLDIDYRWVTAEQLDEGGENFDAVLCLEVVEHVPDPAAFMATLVHLARPGGAMVLATLNRTPKSYLHAIVGAEYVLGWLPRSTHQWNRFVRPSEMAAALEKANAAITDMSGVGYDLLRGEWRLISDVAVNYMVFAVRNA